MLITKKQKYIAIGSLLVIALTIYISSQVKSPRITTPTEQADTKQLETEIPTTNLAVNFPQIIDAGNIQPSESNLLLGINSKQELVLIEGNETKPISLDGEKVINYVSSDKLIFYETGIYANPTNNFQLIDLHLKNRSLINLSFAKPVIGYAISPDNQYIAVLGKYSAQSFTTNLYIYNIKTKEIGSAIDEIQANQVGWVNNNNILIGKKIDTKEPNYTFSVYSLSENRLVLKDQSSSQKNTKFQNGIITFINPITYQLIQIDLNQPNDPIIIRENTSPFLELNISPDNKTIYLLSQEKDVIKILLVLTSSPNQIQSKTIKLGENNKFVSSHFTNKQLYLKVINSKTREIKFIPTK